MNLNHHYNVNTVHYNVTNVTQIFKMMLNSSLSHGNVRLMETFGHENYEPLYHCCNTMCSFV